MGQKNNGTEGSSVSTQRSKSENLDAAPSVKSQFMRLASEVHKSFTATDAPMFAS